MGIEIGLLAQDQIAVFVDAYASSTQVITEIMVYTVDGKLRPLSSHYEGLDRLLVREVPVRCEDINGDGILKFRVSWGEYNEEEDNRKNILQYLYLSNPEELKGLAETGLQEEAVTFTFSPVWTGI